ATGNSINLQNTVAGGELTLSGAGGTFSQTNGLPGTTSFVADARITFADGMSQSVTGGGNMYVQDPNIRTGANAAGVQSATLTASGPINVQAGGSGTGTLTFEKFAPATSATLNLNGDTVTMIADDININAGVTVASNNTIAASFNSGGTFTNAGIIDGNG